ncbi:MAG: MoaD/ThiS family protein [Pelotomaculum sp.]|uniref:Molybdopterin converting factor, small subunit n=1 Tax=Pelotomaculum thermopropionicum (strain DSM 13744 / JCM 10971 / SI) TaxID=370438 RepID=A5CYW1_PELTS|nr:MoaD/ThiS family protein [Pelotomaculum sp.]BAF60808.1 molybdopterin converting factor, small subunit [Pelotomaculum thermopropionicum SI]
MQVEVRVYCGLESFIPGTKFGQAIPVEITENFTGRMLLEKLNIPEKMAFSFMVNGVHKGFDVVLADGDRVSIFPPVGGG